MDAQDGHPGNNQEDQRTVDQECPDKIKIEKNKDRVAGSLPLESS